MKEHSVNLSSVIMDALVRPKDGSDGSITDDEYALFT